MAELNESGDAPAINPAPAADPAPSAGAAPAESAPGAAAAAGSAPGDEPTGGDGDLTELSGTVSALTSDDLDPIERRRLLGRLASQVRARGVGDLFRPKAALRWVTDAVGDIAPHLPVRDRATLEQHFPGLTRDQLAERLIRNASLTTGAVGAASGGVAAIEWVATPTLLTAPVLLAAETVVVVAIELKLVGELHELYGHPVPGSVSQRGVALVQSWAQMRGFSPMLPGAGLSAILGGAVRKELRDRLLRRFGRNLTTYGPLLTGAAVASFLNRRATITLGKRIREDLARGQQPPRAISQ